MLEKRDDANHDGLVAVPSALLVDRQVKQSFAGHARRDFALRPVVLQQFKPAELMQSMIELKTGVCRTVSEARNELVLNLRRVRNIASSLG